jgi:hypothetical protein
MTNDHTQPRTVSAARRRGMRAAGWALVVLGVIVSWMWSAELTIRGAAVNASIAGAVTMLLFCAGIVVIWRVSPHRGRRATQAFRVAVIATALGAIVAGIIPVAVIAQTTGSVAAEVTTGTRSRVRRLFQAISTTRPPSISPSARRTAPLRSWWRPCHFPTTPPT